MLLLKPPVLMRSMPLSVAYSERLKRLQKRSIQHIVTIALYNHTDAKILPNMGDHKSNRKIDMKPI